MAAQNNAQTIALQLEKVRDKVPLLYERDDVLLQDNAAVVNAGGFVRLGIQSQAHQGKYSRDDRRSDNVHYGCRSHRLT